MIQPLKTRCDRKLDKKKKKLPDISSKGLFRLSVDRTLQPKTETDTVTSVNFTFRVNVFSSFNSNFCRHNRKQ